MIKPLPFRAFQIVTAVVKSGGFASAADALNLGQPAVSNAIRRLELDMGEALFERRGRGVSPLPKAIRIADAFTGAEAALSAALGLADDQPVVLNTAPTLAARWLAPRLDALRA
ncbi:MAG: LysR family transcriptional regulator, partial [Rhodobacteraceae bacterium]|nr:LysR family transcriptional regulator [Paracoccaceae bacterium]